MDGQVNHGFHTHCLVKVTVSLELSARRSRHTSWVSHHVPPLLKLPTLIPRAPCLTQFSIYLSHVLHPYVNSALVLLTTQPPRPERWAAVRPSPHSLHPGLCLLSDPPLLPST